MASAAFGAIEAFDTTGYDCQIGGEVRDFDPKPFFKNPKDVRRTDRFAQLAMAAAKMALEDSGIDLEKLERAIASVSSSAAASAD